jgi:ectoine hydroxylase-related dioxygenase (phytanoyl-CoA dioxygenase family)
MEVPWHQDSHFWQMRPLVACSVWIAIDDVTIENGCMRYIPCSHKRGLLSHYVEGRTDVAIGDAVQPELVDDSTAKDDVLMAGKFSIHHSDLIHGSMPNRSNMRRSGLVFRYMPATSHYDRDFLPPGASRTNTQQVDNKRQPIWLVRGTNRHPGNDFKIGHEQFPDLDELVERLRLH